MEVLQSTTEPPQTLCPKCDKPELKKLISASGFRLAGSGWYETDFKADNKRNLTKQEKPKTEDKTKSKKDKKPDTSAKADKGVSKKAD